MSRISHNPALRKAESRLRQLACLGTGGLVNAPSMFAELHQVLGFSFGCMWTCDERLEGTIYYENPQALALMPLLRENFFERDGARLWHSIGDTFRYERGPVTLKQAIKVSEHEFYRSEVYNQCMVPVDQHDFIRIQLRDNERWLGMFGVYRGARDREFSEEDVRLIGRLEPFLAHAMTPRVSTDAEQTSSGQSGMMVVERNGVVRWLSAEARALLGMALGSVPSVLPAELLRAISQLSRIDAGDLQASPPVWRCRNGFGQFTFNIYWLQPWEPGESLLGITLTRQIPYALILFEAMRRHPMPRRQGEVCLQIGLGRSNEQIATMLGIGISSVITHRRAIYDRLDVQSREQLVRKLLDTG